MPLCHAAVNLAFITDDDAKMLKNATYILLIRDSAEVTYIIESSLALNWCYALIYDTCVNLTHVYMTCKRCDLLFSRYSRSNGQNLGQNFWILAIPWGIAPKEEKTCP